MAGGFRELRGTLWAHDHRFFFTAENVNKGALGMINLYGGSDHGNEELNNVINLGLPNGGLLDSGNLDFDVNLIVSDSAFDPNGQLFFDTDGFLGDAAGQLCLRAGVRGPAQEVSLPDPQCPHVAETDTLHCNASWTRRRPAINSNFLSNPPIIRAIQA